MTHMHQGTQPSAAPLPPASQHSAISRHNRAGRPLSCHTRTAFSCCLPPVALLPAALPFKHSASPRSNGPRSVAYSARFKMRFALVPTRAVTSAETGPLYCRSGSSCRVVEEAAITVLYGLVVLLSTHDMASQLKFGEGLSRGPSSAGFLFGCPTVAGLPSSLLIGASQILFPN